MVYQVQKMQCKSQQLCLRNRSLLSIACHSSCFTLFIIYLGLFLLLSCEKDSAGIVPGNITLALTDAAVTETWLTLQTTSTVSLQQVVVWRDTTEIYREDPTGSEIALYDSGLQPNQTYTYRAALVEGDRETAASNTVSVTTLDTTTHNYTWQIDTVGTYGTILNDVFVIDENDIWAVGEINVYNAATGLDTMYNAAHWNGQQWELIKIPAATSFGTYSNGPLLAVFAFSANDVWTFSLAGSFSHWDGTRWRSLFVREAVGSITNIWGTSSEDIYFAGTNGSITHHDGQSWHLVESGTDISIQDIWGYDDPVSGELLVLAVASKKFEFVVPKLFQLNNNSAMDVFFPVFNRPHGIWFQSPRKMYVCGIGIQAKANDQWMMEPDLPPIFYNRIHGSALNDIWVVGDFGIVLHFNGIRWKQFPEFWLTSGNYEGLSMKGKLAVAAGWKEGRGIIVRLRPLN